MSEKTEVDYKKIALALAQRLNFAMTNLKAVGSGAMLNLETNEITGWREYLAEAMEMIPGVKVDREMMALLDLPPAKRRKAIEALKESRKK